ncbi:hypothetical protein Tco_0893775 [Tanacetum coccineum]|uniref:Uncharacterized protein n=1 Tax=Tanacetum coccineum TaxID=301880 RepID=A0ABQ5CCM4_9ASTR
MIAAWRFLLDPNKDADYSIEAQQDGVNSRCGLLRINNNSRSDGDIDVSSKGLMLQQQVLSKDVAAEAAYQLKEKFELSGITVDHTGHEMREIRNNSRIDGI